MFWRTSRKDHDVQVDLGGSCTGPLLADMNTITPNAQTLLMNQGDTLALSLCNTPRGQLLVASDVTTYQTGSMVAGGENGFMNTNDRTSAGPRTGPSDNFTSGDLCEYPDMTCGPAGPRPVIVDETTEKLNGPIAGRQDNYVQNGDLDFVRPNLPEAAIRDRDRGLRSGRERGDRDRVHRTAD